MNPAGFKHHKSIVVYRTPYYQDGSIGSPEIIKKFTTEDYQQKQKKKPKTERLTSQFKEVEVY